MHLRPGMWSGDRGHRTVQHVADLVQVVVAEQAEWSQPPISVSEAVRPSFPSGVMALSENPTGGARTSALSANDHPIRVDFRFTCFVILHFHRVWCQHQILSGLPSMNFQVMRPIRLVLKDPLDQSWTNEPDCL